MRHFLPALLLAACASLAAEEGETLSISELLGEAGQLAEKARAAYAPVHEMKPSLERNAGLSGVRKLIKESLGKYKTAQEIAPAGAKSAEAAVTDLEGMLFWCNKSMVVVVSEAPPPSRASPPQPPVEPSQPDPDPPPPPAGIEPLSAAESKDVDGILRSLSDLYKRIEEGQDLAERCRQRIADIFSVLDASQQAWEARHGPGTAPGWTAAKAYEASREETLERPMKHQKLIQSKLHEIWGLKAQACCKRSQLEYFGSRALSALASFASREGPAIPEEMVDYLNRQLTSPKFDFTPVPASTPQPPPEKADDARTLLDALSEAMRRSDEIAVSIAESDVETERIRKDLEDREKHFTWRKEKSTYAVFELKKNEDIQKAGGKALGKLAAAKAALVAEGGGLTGKIESLRGRLRELDPSCARAVEDWRRKQALLPDLLTADLESWTRKALGMP